MDSTIQEKVWAGLKDRQTWEERQRVFYALVRDGLRRRNKPFKGAADLHLPIVDNAIAKLLPYDINNTFGRERLASFTPLGGQLLEAAAQAAECLDWKLKNESNFAREFAHTRFISKVCGRGVLKVRWDPEKKRLAFDAVDPLYFVVPKGGDEIDDMDWFAHIKRLSIGQYKRDKRYTQDDDLIQQIRGGDKQLEFTKQQEKEHREGLTYSKDDDEIILWEIFERVEEGFRIHTKSPTSKANPRAPFLLNYRWQGEPYQPFVSFVEEITDHGWYAPRGIAEKLAAFEAYGCKLWNSKADWLEFSSKPLFTQDVNQAAVTNTQNIKFAPGEVLPPGLQPGAVPEPPFSLDNEINTVRQLAEETAGSPDFGVTQDDSEGKNGGKSRTATEWNYLGSFANQGLQHKGWISSQSEAEVYWRSWALLVQFGGEELSLISAGQNKILPAQARHDNYLIQADLCPDSWNKQQRVQRSVARFSMFKGDPDIDQIELKRTVLEADDPRLVKKLLVGQSTKTGKEAEDEATEIVLLMMGFPCVVEPGEDHALRIKILAGFMQHRLAGTRVDPVAMQRLQEHLATHVQFLKAQNPQAANAFIKALSTVDPMSQQQQGPPLTVGPGSPAAAPQAVSEGAPQPQEAAA